MNALNFGRRQFRRTALAAALGMTLASGVVYAQSNSSGVIFGRADSATGATVKIVNVDTGLSRELPVSSDGRYRATSLPVGSYKVTLLRDGNVVETRDVQVNIGSGSDVSFAAASATQAQTLEGVQVVGTSLPAIDVSSVDSRTVLTSEQLQRIPVASNVNAAALLAPGVVAGDSRYGGVISFGGASAAENQYYINGFAVTNPLTGLGFATLPFDAIDQQQILTGGYGAEYGRSTGGVVNLTTKRGSNTWKAGAQVQWSPRALTANPRSIYYPQHTGNVTDGTIYQDRSGNKTTNTLYGLYVSGPLIKDKLFIYAAADVVRQDGSRGVTNVLTRTSFDGPLKANHWLGKIDWNITDSHILELTGLGDTNLNDTTIYSYDYATKSRTARLGTEHQKNLGTANSTPGGVAYIGKYTGYITDSLTVDALYGHSRTDHIDVVTGAAGVNCPNIVDNRNVPAARKRVSCAPVQGNLNTPGAYDEVDNIRFDIQYHIGDHDLRVGIDNQKAESFGGLAVQGGATWTYTTPPASGTISGFPELAIPAGSTEIVRRQIFRASGNVKVEQSAQFIEDNWQVSDRWHAYIGLRNEQFKNFNTDGVVFVKQRHQLAPRLGLTWDVFGDSTFKVYANAGRYHLAIPSNVAIRGAGPQLFERQYFTYAPGSIDPITNVPTNPVAISGIHYANGADGSAPDPKTLSAKNLSAYYQDEYILGFDKQLAPDWTMGAKVTYRKLRSIIDDMCDSRPIEAWAARNSITISPDANIPGCFLFNPGKGNTFTVDLNNDGKYENIVLSKADLGFPELKRKYVALNLYVEHQFNQQFYGRAEYVLSHSYGNSEGLLKSDIGQLDPSVTQDWDFPELMIGSNGPLPSDRRHQLKAYGFWQMTPEWMFGANLAAYSGRPKNCLGIRDPDIYNYGSSYFYCDGESPRGSKGRLPWTYQLSLNAEYRPAMFNHDLSLKLDVFNLLNQQREQNIDETFQTGDGNPSPTYTRALSYSAPRSVRLTARYDFSL
ncbi:carboxypeptidase family protein [Luteibacter rhizovicinus]|uniref:Carboxypeptidase family protein n=1 Tax=Luteibacter rhizovicinus TaxID=242606 RepID=A0A4R3YJ33_9GAMM|nr:TonB-dependent receptor [Luteibacter rhizovicinus]TCV92437.1 carboxypeptidase family protein [Luteibacter rhizovicinus]